MVSTYVGENKVFEKMFLAGEIEVELNPQGTFAERMRAGGAGMPAFFTPTAYGTIVAEGKEVRWFDGRPHVMETALTADYAFVKAWKGDPLGNLVFRKHHAQLRAHDGHGGAHDHRGGRGAGARRARSRPTRSHTPGIFVQRIFQGKGYEKRIEKRTLRGEARRRHAIPSASASCAAPRRR